ncbi:MAG: hypothetical protein HJJLKODD_02314 [Phycisphaerae bacterium]|nr:hypothetical protein [Phycisphaerae bacterium]
MRCSGRNLTSAYVLLTISGGMLSVGCQRKAEPTLVDVRQPMVIAVAPVLNHSGSRDIDTLKLADLMISELTQVPGVTTIPLNRVLAQLQAAGRMRVESPAHAVELMEKLGADGIVVMAVSEYDAYTPILGLTAQLYGYGLDAQQRFDPEAQSRAASPLDYQGLPQEPRVQYQRVFLGRDEELADEIRRYERDRQVSGSPHGWRLILASQEEFQRFCCYTTARALIRQEVTQVLARVDRNSNREVGQP